MNRRRWLVWAAAPGVAVWLLVGCGTSSKTVVTDSPATVESVVALYQSNHPRRAYEEARAVVARDRDSAEAWFWLGVTSTDVQASGTRPSYEEAINAYEKAIELKPDYAPAYNNLGDLCERISDAPRALKYYQLAVRMKPDFAEAYAGMGDVYFRSGEFDKAVGSYEKSLRLEQSQGVKVLTEHRLAYGKRASNDLRTRGILSAETLRGLGGTETMIRGPGDPPMAMTLHSIEFARDKYALPDVSETGRRQLGELARALSPDERYVIEGHTCTCGGAEHNQRLGLMRAQTVKDYIVQHSNVPASNLYVLSYGDRRPVAESPHRELSAAECDRDEMHSLNRRVVVQVWRSDGAPPSSAAGTERSQAVPTPSARVGFFWRSDTGPARRLTDGATLHSGDGVGIAVQVYHPCWVYVFWRFTPDEPRGSGSAQAFCIYPSEKYSRGALGVNPLQPARKYWLPGFGEYIPLDDNPGSEEILVYIRSSRSAELEELVASCSDGSKGAPVAGGGQSAQEEGEGVSVGWQEVRGVKEFTVESDADVYLPANCDVKVAFQHV
jgi:outer membrane protein OmpA-like peptidoglycan-associated protein